MGFAIIDWNSDEVINLGEISYAEAKEKFCLYIINTLDEELCDMDNLEFDEREIPIAKIIKVSQIELVPIERD